MNQARKHLLEIADYRNFETKKKQNERFLNRVFFYKWKLLVEAFIEEIKPGVAKKHEFEYRNESYLMAIF